jgi:hypothetical protein
VAREAELEEMRGEMTATHYAQEMLAEYHKMEGLIYEEFNRDTQMVSCPFTPVKWLLSIDFGYNHPWPPASSRSVLTSRCTWTA